MKPPSAQSEPNFIVLQRSASSALFFSGSMPWAILSAVSTPRVEPMRQGVHLPQLSMAQNSIANRACFSMSAESSKTVMPAWPIRPSLAAKAS
ncbi:Uncharacterised protein [Mycobacterium tuberculosis]|nr:Uncharacterised protein [Mycobacterium tuberculosis]